MAPFMDRDKVTKPTAQIGFIKFVLIPMFETVAKVRMTKCMLTGPVVFISWGHGLCHFRPYSVKSLVSCCSKRFCFFDENHIHVEVHGFTNICNNCTMMFSN